MLSTGMRTVKPCPRFPNSILVVDLHRGICPEVLGMRLSFRGNSSNRDCVRNLPMAKQLISYSLGSYSHTDYMAAGLD